MKKIILFFLIGILIVFTGDLLINAFGPVQILRLAKYKNVVTVNCYPQWINDEEYCYLEVTNYNDGGTGPGFGIMPVPCSFFWGKISNADFSIYKVNINKPSEKILVKKISERVAFTLWGEKINGDEILFKISTDKRRMALILRIPIGLIGYDYRSYFLDINGNIFEKKLLSWEWRDHMKISDLSFDLDKVSLIDFNDFYIKDMISNSITKWSNYGRWISKTKSINYSLYPEVLKVYLENEQGADCELVYELHYKEYGAIKDLLWDATISENSSILFLNKIGIFEKKDGKWQIVKESQNMPNFYYPAISPNGQRLVGIKDGQKVVALELKELLR